MPVLKANGFLLHYEMSGPADAPVVVFSNSLGATLAMWDAQVAALAPRFRCLRYDTRGHGRSSPAPGAITIDVLAADLAALLDGLGIGQADVVGLSLGGMAAQLLAVTRPDLVRRLVLIATSADMTGVPVWAERAVLVRARGVAAVIDTVIGRLFTPAFRADQPAVVAQTAAQIATADVESYAACCLAIGALAIRDRIAAIAAPTLILAGATDAATPVAMLADIQARIAASDLVVIGGAAHLVNVEQAAAVNRQLLAFLEPVPGRSVRAAVLGAAHVDRLQARATAFDAPWQNFLNRVPWGEIWGDDTLPRKTRSMLTLAMMATLHREEEFKLHLRPALRHGVTADELRAVLMQVAIYAGVPAANAAFRWTREKLGAELA